jgi:hypothetical protein
MRLTELKPRWSGLPGGIKDGVTFQCPHCGTQRLGIKFSPPIDPEGWWPKIAQPTYAGMNVWHRQSGETFDTLTITPSVNAKIDVAGHWHGYITNGEVT